MAERRMFAKTIVLSDAFLDLPMSARCLYFTLGMLADDDGFVNAPRAIMRQCGASDDDMKVLLGKKFVLLFESGVIVIKHWRINNYLRSDRYSETKYANEKASLQVEDNGSYRLGNQDGIPDDNQRYTDGIPGGIPNDGIPRIDKYSKDKVSIGEVRKGECEGETKSTDGRTDSNLRLKRVDFFCGRIKMSEDVGYKMFNRDYWIEAAEREGIPRTEIEARMAQIEKEEQK